MLIKHISIYILLPTIFWTIFIVAFYYHEIDQHKFGIDRLVNTTEKYSYRKDMQVRAWAIRHDGIYVKPTKQTPPNPYLKHIKDRDVVTSKGIKLTLMNPAYIIRDINNEDDGNYYNINRITSLRPLNPINKPDQWEIKALNSFRTGKKKYVESVDIKGIPHLRVMRPFIVEKGCLKCHGHQGYKVGDIRGGVGNYVNLSPFIQEIELHKLQIIHENIVIYFIGVAIIILFYLFSNKLLRNKIRSVALLDAIPDQMFRVKKDGTFLGFESKNSELYIEPSKIIGNNISKVFAPHLCKTINDKIIKVLSKNELQILEYQLKMPRTGFRDYEARFTKSGRDEVTAIVRDITEKKNRIKELKEEKIKANSANFAKGQFLSAMSHDIRTPLNAILGMGDVLRDSNLSSDQLSALRVLTHSGETLLALINDILDFSKVEAGQLELNIKSFNLHVLLQNIQEMFLGSVKSKKLNINLGSLVGCPIWVNGDGERIKQIFINLIGNAIKFTNTGSITINAKKIDDEKIEFSVADTGIGIDDKQLSEIFLPYKQAIPSVYERYGGTGLGLAICKHQITAMGGEIKVKSEVDKGTIFTFTLSLPLADSMQNTKTQYDKKRKEVKNGRSLKILLVDDNEDNRILIKEFLKKSPHKITEAMNGQEGIDLFKDSDFDIVLMDIRMPIVDGIAATKIIRQYEKEQKIKATPLIALTANAIKDEINQAMVAGFDEYLLKPIGKQELLRFLANY